MTLFNNSDADEKAPTRPAPYDLSVPAERRRASLIYHFQDHAFLRYHWTNLAKVAPGVWRSNHPTHDRFDRYRAMGIKAILNLRGPAHNPPYLFEKDSCDRLGLTLVSVGLYARKAPSRNHVLALFQTFRTIERPFLMHCKSGADRAGFAAALYLLSQEGATLAEARKQLSWRFLHFRASRTGILDHILDLYAAKLATGPIGIEDWFRDHYDPAAAMTGFRRWP
jgi:protein tyrosine phosphatase (PTP) superfamily phosphohydrolase (DUF442 family)